MIFRFQHRTKPKGFNVFQIEREAHATRIYSRNDFYKICLTMGKSIIHYADMSFEVEDTVLFVGNSHIFYFWKTFYHHIGYTCLFSEDFLKASDRSESLQQSPLFKIGGIPILKITKGQRDFLNAIFRKIMDEQQT